MASGNGSMHGCTHSQTSLIHTHLFWMKLLMKRGTWINEGVVVVHSITNSFCNVYVLLKIHCNKIYYGRCGNWTSEVRISEVSLFIVEPL